MLKTAASPGYFLNRHGRGRCVVGDAGGTHTNLFNSSYLGSLASVELKTKEVGGKPNRYPGFPPQRCFLQFQESVKESHMA